MSVSTDTATSTPEAASSSVTSTESLSQFVARVLDQLSLSAWLPSAALVLTLAFVIRLNAILNGKAEPRSALPAVGKALSSLAGTSIGGAVLLVAAVVVLTMVTQAFSFEAIRMLEGYWGTNSAVEWVARCRCDHYRRIRKRLEARHTKLTKAAWTEAASELARIDESLVARGLKAQFTPNMIAALGAPVLGQTSRVKLKKAEGKLVRETDWRIYAPPDLIRRRLNVTKRLRDFPQAKRMLPTRLGNVLRSYEDRTGSEPVEALVQEVFDVLPPALQAEHDEQRTRLDLYCSMIFVIAVVTVTAVTLLVQQHVRYAIGAITGGLSGMWLMNGAAVASARAYGSLIVIIARYAQRTVAGRATSHSPH
jgi:hypothetical protein